MNSGTQTRDKKHPELTQFKKITMMMGMCYPQFCAIAIPLTIFYFLYCQNYRRGWCRYVQQINSGTHTTDKEHPEVTEFKKSP